ncbi:MAG: class I SAM-dependent DNA methyltransferase [Acidimicrobiales bacterium]
MGYETDLAEIHHLHYDQVARSAADELIERLGAAGITSGLVVDLGCGSGVTASLLTKAGFDVFGVDLSPDMIELAKAEAPQATFECASLFDVEIPSCVAVTAISEAVNYAFDGVTSEGTIAALAQRIHDALQPNGLVMLDVATPDRAEAGSVVERRFEGDDYVILVRAEASASGRRLVRDITLFREAGELWRRSDERHEQVLYTPEMVSEVLLEAGFWVEVLSSYADFVFPAGWNGFVGSKRA